MMNFSLNYNQLNYIDTSIDYYFTEGYDTEKITVDDLMDMDCKKNKYSVNITTDLMKHLIANKNIEYIRELLEFDKHNKNIINFTDTDNENLLHFSVFCNSYDLSRLFLKYGADPNKKDNENQSPIFRIVFADDEKIIGLLLEYGAILDMRDSNGNTPLHLAVSIKNYKIIKSLLDYGADPLIHNNNNLMAIDFALSKINDCFIWDEHILNIFSEYTK